LKQEPRRVDQPSCGRFKMKLVRKGRLSGPWVPAMIDCVDGVWTTTINGEVIGEPGEDQIRACVFDVWLFSVQIEQSEYDYMMAMKAWAEANDPTHPAANPRKVIDLLTMSPVYKSKQGNAA
jgi:hypothetical protein